MKVVLVGDSKGARALTKSLLTASGVSEILEASNATGAIGLLRANTGVDLVLIDVMDPATCTGRIKHDPAGRQVRVVVFSQVSCKPAVLACLKAGADTYVLKPATPEMLRSRLEPPRTAEGTGRPTAPAETLGAGHAVPPAP